MPPPAETTCESSLRHPRVRICGWPAYILRHGPAGRTAGHAPTLSPNRAYPCLTRDWQMRIWQAPRSHESASVWGTTVAWVLPAEPPGDLFSSYGIPPPPLCVRARPAADSRSDFGVAFPRATGSKEKFIRALLRKLERGKNTTVLVTCPVWGARTLGFSPGSGFSGNDTQ